MNAMLPNAGDSSLVFPVKMFPIEERSPKHLGESSDEWEYKGIRPSFPEEAEKRIDRMVAPVFLDSDSVGLMLQINSDNTRHPAPWAIIFFDHEYRLVKHYEDICGGVSGMSLIAWASKSGLTAPDASQVATVLVKSKSVLQQVTANSSIFTRAWELLKDCDETQNWVCFPPMLDSARVQL